MKIKVYLSDEGYGHVVRQEAIIKELFKLRNDLDITIQTQEKIDVVKEKFGDSVTYVEKFNNIKTTKTLTGYLDLEETKRCFERDIGPSSRAAKAARTPRVRRWLASKATPTRARTISPRRSRGRPGPRA